MITTQFTRRLVAIAASSLLACAVAVTAAAQTSTNNSGIEGRIVDDSGATLPGVTVTISSPALQSQPETIVGQRRPLPLHHAARRRLHRQVPAARLQDRRAGQRAAVGQLRRHHRREDGARRDRGDDHGDRPVAGRRHPHGGAGVDHQERSLGAAALVAQLRGHGQARPRHPRQRHSRRRRQQDRRRPRLAHQLRIEPGRQHADVRRRQHRRRRRLLRRGRDRGDGRPRRRQRSRDRHAGHGLPDDREIGRQPVPRHGVRRVPDAQACRATTSPTSCGRRGSPPAIRWTTTSTSTRRSAAASFATGCGSSPASATRNTSTSRSALPAIRDPTACTGPATSLPGRSRTASRRGGSPPGSSSSSR